MIFIGSPILKLKKRKGTLMNYFLGEVWYRVTANMYSLRCL